jgi:putative endonuclease
VSRAPGSRRAAFRRGILAEWSALACLVLKGYWPLARRFVAQGGEIDLVVVRGRTVVFVEVKFRASREEALLSVTDHKLRRIAAAARAFRSQRRLDDSHVFRCDVVIVGRRGWPEHIVNVGLPGW